MAFLGHFSLIAFKADVLLLPLERQPASSVALSSLCLPPQASLCLRTQPSRLSLGINGHFFFFSKRQKQCPWLPAKVTLALSMIGSEQE